MSSPQIPNSKDSELKFFHGNAKLPDNIIHFSLPSGYTCTKCADTCLTYANPNNGQVKTGKHTSFYCYSAMMEATYPSVRKARWENYNRLQRKTSKEMVKLIVESLVPYLWEYSSNHGQLPIVRIHVGGEFFSPDYFEAWCSVINRLPFIKFYAFTKALDIWTSNIESIPHNLNLTASMGGKFDDLVPEFGLKYNRVVYSKEEAERHQLPIDHDDWYAHSSNLSFATLLHGVQPKGSKAAAALKLLKSEGFKGYGKASQKIPPATIVKQFDSSNQHLKSDGLSRLLETTHSKN